MKKIINYISTAILSMTAIAVVSCGSNNTDPDPEKPISNTIDVKYALADFKDLHQYDDVDITYIDAAGKEVTETSIKTPWEKEVKAITPPFTAKMAVKLTRKAGVQIIDKTVTFSTGHAIMAKKNADSGYDISFTQNTITISYADKIEIFLKKYETEGIKSEKAITNK